MDTTAEWISAHALSLWAIVLACVLVGADMAWRRAVRHRANEEARLLRPLTVGATVMVAGFIPGKTETLALSIYHLVQLGHDASAAIFLSISVLLAFGALWFSERLLKRAAA